MMPLSRFLPSSFLPSALPRPPCLPPPLEGAVPSQLCPRPSCGERPSLTHSPSVLSPDPACLPLPVICQCRWPHCLTWFSLSPSGTPRPHTCSPAHLSVLAPPTVATVGTMAPWHHGTMAPATVGRPHPLPACSGLVSSLALCSLLNPLPPPPASQRRTHCPPSQRTQKPSPGGPSVASANPNPASLIPTSCRSGQKLCPLSSSLPPAAAPLRPQPQSFPR